MSPNKSPPRGQALIRTALHRLKVPIELTRAPSVTVELPQHTNYAFND
jgi:hypothetical protein